MGNDLILLVLHSLPTTSAAILEGLVGFAELRAHGPSDLLAARDGKGDVRYRTSLDSMSYVGELPFHCHLLCVCSDAARRTT